MKTSSKALTFFLICLFLTLSFNAYACLVPIFEPQQLTHGSDCDTPGEKPITQFCDGFKTLAVQSVSDTLSARYSQVPLLEETSPVLPEHARFPATVFLPDDTFKVVHKDILLLISVFRI
ncbi:MAG: hypothetical protein WD425_17495 [Nitrospirales bacterium]